MFKIEVDTRALLAALDKLGDRVAARVKAAAKVSAESIAREARARVARHTGQTAKDIHVAESHDKTGYVVLPYPPFTEIVGHTMRKTGRFHTQRVTTKGLPGWLEFGTRYMTARPYFFASARLEEGAHDRRIRQAVQDTIDEVGLGD